MLPSALFHIVGFDRTAATTAAGLPKTMVHPGYPNGAATGLLVKDYKGQHAATPAAQG